LSPRFPSYQWSTHFGRFGPAANVYRMWAHAGYVSGLMSPASATTATGASSRIARNAMFAVWHAMSPSAPVPKSQYPRQSCGWYAGFFPFLASSRTAYGRIRAGPIHSSQWTCWGTAVSVGRATMSGACFQ